MVQLVGMAHVRDPLGCAQTVGDNLLSMDDNVSGWAWSPAKAV